MTAYTTESLNNCFSYSVIQKLQLAVAICSNRFSRNAALYSQYTAVFECGTITLIPFPKSWYRTSLPRTGRGYRLITNASAARCDSSFYCHGTHVVVHLSWVVYYRQTDRQLISTGRRDVRPVGGYHTRLLYYHSPDGEANVSISDRLKAMFNNSCWLI